MLKPSNMKKYLSLLAISACCSPTIVTLAQNPSLPASNPFSTVSTLPYHAPPFDRIKTAHYGPALNAGILQQMKEIQQIANNKAAPTFFNTLVALEKSGQLFNRVNNVFYIVVSANSNDTLQKLDESYAPKIAALNDAIFLNSKLFSRVKTLYDQRGSLKLDAESDRLLDYYYKKFVMSGALLSESDKALLKKLNEAEAGMMSKFSNIILAANKNAILVIDDVSQLAGLSASEIQTARLNADSRGLTGKWLLNIQNTTQVPSLSLLQNRKTRQELFESSWNRASRSDSNDTRSLVIQLATIRAKKAELLGYPNYATWKLQDQMAVKPENISAFFAKLAPAATGKAARESEDIQAVIDKQNGGFALQPWDWDFYAQQVRKEKYNFDDDEVKPYFDMYTVLEKGVFYAAEQMYGLTFKRRLDIPVYDSDVRVYEVFESGKPLALFYADFYKRDNKRGGAWMSNAVGQSYLLNTRPVIFNTCNFTKPAAGEPSLISFDDVGTMFHEFGHSLHGLFASQKYPTLSGTSTARDFVEFPSQFNEHWAMDPKVLKNYALHYKTGIPIPQALLNKIKKAESFNRGYAITEAIAAASLDLYWHKLTPGQAASITDVDAFEKDALTNAGLNISYVPPRYRTSYFLHIWFHDYSAGYYAYQWTKMLEEDAYVWMKQHGGMTRANGQRFREMVLSKGNTMDYNTMFSNFTGHSPQVQPMIDEQELDQ